MRQTASKLLRDHYVSVGKDLLGPLQAMLTTARAEFGGDLDKFIVLLEIALRTLEDRRIHELTAREFITGDAQSYPSLGTNIRSVAQSSGIPRETVRRKVLELLAEGWIARTDNTLALTPKSSRHLTRVRESILDLAARNYVTVKALAEREAED